MVRQPRPRPWTVAGQPHRSPGACTTPGRTGQPGSRGHANGGSRGRRGASAVEQPGTRTRPGYSSGAGRAHAAPADVRASRRLCRPLQPGRPTAQRRIAMQCITPGRAASCGRRRHRRRIRNGARRPAAGPTSRVSRLTRVGHGPATIAWQIAICSKLAKRHGNSGRQDTEYWILALPDARLRSTAIRPKTAIVPSPSTEPAIRSRRSLAPRRRSSSTICFPDSESEGSSRPVQCCRFDLAGGRHPRRLLPRQPYSRGAKSRKRTRGRSSTHESWPDARTHECRPNGEDSCGYTQGNAPEPSPTRRKCGTKRRT